MKITLNPTRWLWRMVGRAREKQKASRLYFQLFREESDCLKRARHYEDSDRYLAGLNAGRAEILRRWGEHPSSDTPSTP